MGHRGGRGRRGGRPERLGRGGPATVAKKETGQEQPVSFGQSLRDSILEGHTATVIILDLFVSFVVGGLRKAFSNTMVLHAWGNFFSDPGHALAAAWDTAVGAYVEMFEGSNFNPHTVAALFQQASFGTAVHDGYQ